MKKIAFFAMTAVGILLGSCSSNDATESGGKEVPSEGYIGVEINLPTVPFAVTRAANDNYDDGEAYEYNVQDCAILFFEGAAEANSKLISAQNVLLPFTPDFTDADNDNVTYSFTATSRVAGFSGGTNKLYALALVNYTNVMTIAGDGTPTVAGTTLALNTTTFADFVTTLKTNADFISKSGATNYFFMTNAVLSAESGGYGALTAPKKDDLMHLAELDPNKIQDTEIEARKEENLAGEIFVERAVAKVTLSVAATKVETGIGTPLNINSVDGWTLDNMEPQSYVTKNTGFLETTPVTDYIPYTSGAFASNYYRMVGNTSVRVDDPTTNPRLDKTKPNLYRSYWCIDPQYSVDATGMLAGTAYVGTDKAQYCYENTFNTAHQNYKNSTRAIIKVTTNGGNFFTVNEDQTLYIKGDAETYAEQNVVNNTAVVNAFNNGLNPGKSWTIDASSFTFGFTRDEATGRYKMTELKLSDAVKAKIGDTFKSTFETDIAPTLTAAMAAANTNVILREYKNGEMWYEARIQHFADPNSPGYTSGTFGATDTDLAPWNKWELNKPTGGNTAGSYPAPDAEKNYLGRYGMVRNNWYDIEVTAFKKLGKPVDPKGQINNPDIDYPDTPDTPDDDLRQYISARIHVLSWAKRIQKWSF